MQAPLELLCWVPFPSMVTLTDLVACHVGSATSLTRHPILGFAVLSVCFFYHIYHGSFILPSCIYILGDIL